VLFNPTNRDFDYVILKNGRRDESALIHKFQLKQIYKDEMYTLYKVGE
jgi:hypothetical protein